MSSLFILVPSYGNQVRKKSLGTPGRAWAGGLSGTVMKTGPVVRRKGHSPSPQGTLSIWRELCRSLFWAWSRACLNHRDTDTGKCWRQEKGTQRMRWFGGFSDSKDMNLSKIQEIVKDREVWHAAVLGAEKSQTRLGNWKAIWHLLGFSARVHQKLACKSSPTESSSWPPLNSKVYALVRETSGF